MDIHKKVRRVVVTGIAAEVEDATGAAVELECRRFETGARERNHLVSWLQQHQVREVFLEGKPVRAASVNAGGAGGREEEGQPFSSRISPTLTEADLPGGRWGGRPPPGAAGLEDPARWG
jgi:hypothetical protein